MSLKWLLTIITFFLTLSLNAQEMWIGVSDYAHFRGQPIFANLYSPLNAVTATWNGFNEHRFSPKANATSRLISIRTGAVNTIAWVPGVEPMNIQIPGTGEYLLMTTIDSLHWSYSVDQYNALATPLHLPKQSNPVMMDVEANASYVLYHQNADGFESDKFISGKGLEIVPVTDVYNQYQGPARPYKFKVLLDGRPLANHPVKFWSDTHGIVKIESYETNRSGVFRTALNCSRYMVTTYMLSPLATGSSKLYVASLGYGFHYKGYSY